MNRNLEQTDQINLISSLEDRLNALNLNFPVTMSDDFWSLNASEGRNLTVDFTVFDSDQLSWVETVIIGHDEEQIRVSTKTLAKLLFIGINSRVTNTHSNIFSAIHTVKMLFYFLSANKLLKLDVDALERFLCFYLVNDMDGTEIKRLITPTAYANRPILAHLRKIKTTLYRYALEAVIGTFSEVELVSRMNSACEKMLDMTLNDYMEGGSFNYLGLEVGKHYIDHSHW